MNRRLILLLAVVLGATAVLLAVSGGFRATVGGFRISARSPFAAGLGALAAAAWWVALARRPRSIASDLEASWHALERHASRLIGVVALIAAIVAATFATRSAAGADASGYLSQAPLWYDRTFFIADPVSLFLHEKIPELPWDQRLTTPLGWRPTALPGMQAPTYPPGLPMLMAIPEAIWGIDGANAVIVASAAVAVWATGMMVGGAAGIIAALLLALSPAFIYQSIQPMSDVPVTAAWMLCFVLLARTRSTFEAGMACAIAVLIRPNLAPLAIVPLFTARNRWSFAAPVAIAAGVLASLQWTWYGSPFRSGYGSTEELFALGNVAPNAVRYFNWLLATAPLLVLAPLGFARLRQGPIPRALGMFSILVIVAYLVYGVFEHWSYLRFLLPALAVFAIFAATGLTARIERWPVSWRTPIFLLLVLGVAAHGLRVARSRDTFKLADQLRRVGQVGDFVNRTVPASAVIVSGEQSGSMRYYTGRPILRWEAASPAELSSAITALEQTDRPVYIALDAWEDELFRTKFAGASAGALDWPPVVEAGASHRTKLWRVADRARFLSGENLPTIRLP